MLPPNPHVQPLDPSLMVIFGASGDLTRRKLMPALYRLHQRNRLPPGFAVAGFAVTPQSQEEFRQGMREAVEEFGGDSKPGPEWDAFAANLYYASGDFTRREDFDRLEGFLEEIQEGRGDRDNRVYYFAAPPAFYEPLIANLGAARMASQEDGWRRVVVEKPFGRDLKSAQALNRLLRRSFEEEQVYRIDHYLGKETVQNILVFRFGNTIFEPVWNRNFIDHVQITVAEAVGVENRGAYYDQAGVVRDMFQNHLMQLLTFAAMEPPAAFEAEALRNEKVKVLRAVRPIGPGDVAERTVRAQYEGYCDEPSVAPESQTPTFAAVQWYVDNWRWQGVPFYLRSGKKLAAKTTEIIIQFKSPPHLMFPVPSDGDMTPNAMALCLEPDEGIHLRFEAKVPDTDADTRSVIMQFSYAQSFGPRSLPQAYERLLLEVMQGDGSLFARADETEFAWSLIDPILAGWDAPQAPPLGAYGPGTWGPPEANDFLRRDNRLWRHGCEMESPAAEVPAAIAKK